MGKIIVLDIELGAIRSFLEMVFESVSAKYDEIYEKSESEEYEHDDDQANALFYPTMWGDIAIKSTLGELNALFESELHNLAVSARSKEKESFEEKNKKLISDLPLNKIIKIIEDFYKIDLQQIEFYDEIRNIRNDVNSFKHRKGFKHPFKDQCKKFPEWVELDKEKTFSRINIFRQFMINLWKKTEL